MHLKDFQIVSNCFDSPLSHFDPATFLDLVDAALLVVDTQHCVVYANRRAQSLLGASLTALQGRPVKHFFRDVPFVNTLLQQGMQWEGEDDPKWPPTYLAREAKRNRLNELVQVRAHRLDDELTGTHLLLQLDRVRHTKANCELATTGQFALPDFSNVANAGDQDIR